MIQQGPLTSGISGAPENNRPVLVLLGTEDIVESNGEAVQVANVQRAKVVVESVVQETVINGEVAWCGAAAARRRDGVCRSLRSLPGRQWCFAAREKGIRRRTMGVGAEIQAVYVEPRRAISKARIR